MACDKSEYASGRQTASHPSREASGRRFTRRSALASVLLGSVGAASGQSSGPELPAPGPKLRQRLLRELSVPDGRYAGAYRTTPGGAVNWYFANVGLWFFAGDHPDEVRRYLDAYLRVRDPIRHNIEDVAPDLAACVPPDSDDAYAGTLLRLAVRYTRATGDYAWWRTNLRDLKAICYSNLLTQIKPNGLLRAFQAPHKNGFGYLMDQCEAYAGLRDFGELLIETDDPDAHYYSGFGMYLGIAIHNLFDAKRNLWLWCDADVPDSVAWYPDLTAQIYPHLFDVHSADAPGDYSRLHRGYEILRDAAPDWPERPQDRYPWLVVAYYAASHTNDVAPALEMAGMVRRYFLPGSVNTGCFTIADLGYAAGIVEAASQKSGIYRLH